MKASDKFLHHWKELHLYLSGKLISSHCELYTQEKVFLKICSEMRFYDNEILAIFKNLLEFKITVIILLLGLNHLPYLRRTTLRTEPPSRKDRSDSASRVPTYIYKFKNL